MLQTTDSKKYLILDFFEKGLGFIPAPLRFIALTVMIITVWAVLFFYPATEYPAGTLYPACPFHAITGFHCAGCGSLRALSCIAKGDVYGAWKKNKLTVLCLPYLFWAYLSYGAACFKIKWPKYFLKAGWIWFLLVVILLYWILRNIPVYPFYLLAPQ